MTRAGDRAGQYDPHASRFGQPIVSQADHESLVRRTMLLLYSALRGNKARRLSWCSYTAPTHLRNVDSK